MIVENHPSKEVRKAAWWDHLQKINEISRNSTIIFSNRGVAAPGRQVTRVVRLLFVEGVPLIWIVETRSETGRRGFSVISALVGFTTHAKG